jgi:hypothetical protein
MHPGKLAILLSALLLAITTPAFAAKAKTTSTSTTTATVALTASESEDLTFMREEEKLARDTYHVLYQKYGLSVFSNIESSEQSHMDALLKLLEAYKLPDPAASTSIGVFKDPELQALYDALIAWGNKSALDALLVGGAIEETDMEDIKAAMLRTTKADILKAYDNLICGSRNHLRAFAASVESMTGKPYKAQVLEQEEVDAIIDSPKERCGT